MANVEDPQSISSTARRDANSVAESYIRILFGEDRFPLGNENDSVPALGDFSDSDEDSESLTLEGLQDEISKYGSHEMVASILCQTEEVPGAGMGIHVRELTSEVEEKLKSVELESIQDYMKESDNLIHLQHQIHVCDDTLTQMENLLGGFQADLGAVSAEIKSLQDKSKDIGIKLRNRKAIEGKLGRFLEDMVLPPDLIRIVLKGEVDDNFVKALEVLSRKLQFASSDAMAQDSAALREVRPELERLRIKAIIKARNFLMNRMWNLRKPKTNIQILQQNVLLKYKFLATFLKIHGKELYKEVSDSYVEIVNKVLSLHFRTYILSLEKLQLDVASRHDLIGEQDGKAMIGLFTRSRDIKNRSTVFSLGERANVLKDLDQPALIPHISETSGIKYPYEVLFRSLHKLQMDSATSEYLFCLEFFGEESTFDSIFHGPLTVIQDHVNGILPTCFDAIGLLIMIRMTHQHQLIMAKRRVPCLDAYFDELNMLLWPRFKIVLDLHLQSVRQASPRSLWVNDVHPHYVARRYAEFTASMLQLNMENWDNQLDLSLDRMRSAVDHLLVELSHLFSNPKQRTVFLINNYDLILAVFKEAGVKSGKATKQFEDLLGSFTTVFVEEVLKERFGKLINFVKKRAGTLDEPGGRSASAYSAPAGSPVTVAEMRPLLREFSDSWKSAIELMHKDVITSFSNFVCGMDILRAALTQLLLYYTRFSDCLKKVEGGSSLTKDVVSIPSIMYEIRKYSRTF